MRDILPVLLALSPLAVAAVAVAQPPAGLDPVPTESTRTGVVDGFDFPVGPPDGAGYVVSQSFGENAHLGEDWNGPGGGNTDLGDPVMAIGRGRVTEAQDLGDNGWGHVVRIVHSLPDGSRVESLYAHLDRIDVAEGQWVERRDPVGTIGTAHGRWLAHLHLELRALPHLPLGRGYGDPADLYLDPSTFIAARRPGRDTPQPLGGSAGPEPRR